MNKHRTCTAIEYSPTDAQHYVGRTETVFVYIDALETRVSALETDVAELRNDVAELRNGFTEMRHEMQRGFDRMHREFNDARQRPEAQADMRFSVQTVRVNLAPEL